MAIPMAWPRIVASLMPLSETRKVAVLLLEAAEALVDVA